MNILVIGGTQFLGRHLVNVALERGHTVTLFNRGNRNPFPQLETIKGDRDPDKGNGLEALKHRNFDAVIDPSGYVPRIVKASAELLKDHTPHYTFISSISVYAGFEQPTAEDAPLAKLEDETTEAVTGGSYGGLKVLCEQAAESVFPGQTLNIRPGLIVGEFDPTDRFTYWVERVARGGKILVPATPDLETQFIDAADLATWTIRMVEQSTTGVFNATGNTTTIGQVLETIKTTLTADASFEYVPDAFLLEHNVNPWMGENSLPLWIPSSDEGSSHFARVPIQKALEKHLGFRPLEYTVRDTTLFVKSRGADYVWKSGLTPEKELELLEAWQQTKAS
jgi:2'-hydroxyisoflavone reductase